MEERKEIIMSISKRNYPIHTETIVISARVPKSLLNNIDKLCKQTGRSRSDIVTQILTKYFLNEYTEIKSDEFNFETVE